MVLRKGLFAAVGLAVCLALSGCAALGGAALDVGVSEAQGPAIAAIEAGVAGQFEKGIDTLAVGATDEQAVNILQGAQVAMARLSVARVAYEATIGRDAPLAVQRQVEAARASTDAAFAELMQRLAERLRTPVPRI